MKNKSLGANEIEQVVVVVLVSPDGRSVCLSLSDGAKKDGKLNLSPPQTVVDVEAGETQLAAVYRCVWDELLAVVDGQVADLYSMRLELPEGHHSGQSSRQYHWKVAFAAGKELRATDREAHWYHLTDIDAQIECMSMSKKKMFKAALGMIRRRAPGDPCVIRKDICTPQQCIQAAS